MSAKLHCSNCGEEITNLSFSMGKKQWIWMLVGFLPMVFVIVWMNLWLFPSHDFSKDLQITLTDTRISERKIDVFGKLSNSGEDNWERVTVEAEFFNKAGQFLDETSNYLSLSLQPGGEENFRVTLSNPDERITEEDPKVVLKITGADVDRF